MKKTLKLTILLVLGTLGIATFNGCKKDREQTEQNITTNQDLLSVAKKWYNNQLTLSRPSQESDLNISALQPDWAAAKIKTNSGKQEVIGVPMAQSNNEYIELNVVVSNGEAQGIFKRYRRVGYKQSKLLLYSSSGRLMNSGAYDARRHVMRQPKLKLELLQSLTPMNKTMSGDGGIDLEEVTIHGTAPGNGGNPGGYNPVNPSFPTFPVGGGSGGSGSGGSGNAGGGAGGSGSNGNDDEAGGGGGGGGPIEWEQPGIMPGDLSCRSFKFQQVGTSNSQSAIVTGLPSPTFSVAGGGNSSRSFPLGDIIVDAPLTLANGTTISAGTAAAAAAEAANDAVKILGTIYGLGNKWRTATDATYERDFITTMETFLKVAVPGARVQKRGTDGRTGVSPSKAEYDGYLDWLFGTGC